MEDKEIGTRFKEFLAKQKECKHEFELEHKYDGICDYTQYVCKKCGLIKPRKYRPSYMD